MSRLAYLAGPIDQGHGLAGREDWRGQIVEELNALGFDVFRPDLAFNAGPASAAIQAANDAVIDVCQAGVVCLPAGVPTLGTPVEIERMLTRKTPVLIVTDVERSVQIDSWRRRGALVCHPKELDTGAELLELAHQVAEQTPTTSFSQRMKDLSISLKALSAPTPLVFEAAPGCDDHAFTPTLPTRGYADDAGLDLYTVGDHVIPAGAFRDVGCGVKVDIPAGHWAMITGRSSTLRRRGLLVNPGVIDAGWTGELFAGVQNLGAEDVHIGHGDRLAQLILLPAPVVGREPEWGRVPKKDRGENGFGSTG